MAVESNTKGPSILSHFTGLASLDQKERADAAVNLLLELKEFQDNYEGDNVDGKCDELAYSLKRLIRGLASSHHGARQGFALALTELLAMFADHVGLKEVLEMMDEFTKVTAGNKGQEERDNYFGKVFGYSAILESGRLFGADGDREILSDVISRLLELSGMKSYLPEPCYHVLVARLGEIGEATVREALLPTLEPLLQADDWSPETLALALAMQKHFPDLDYKSLFKGWKRSTLLHAKNFPKFQKIMVEASSAEHGHLHMAWRHVVDMLLQADTDLAHEFWATIVDGGLFTSSHDRKYVGLQLLELFVDRLPAQAAGRLFTARVLQTLINNAANEKNYLQKAARHALEAVKAACQKDPEKAMVVLTQLLGTAGSRHFDRVTGSDTVQSLVSSLKSEHVKTYLTFLMEVFHRPGLIGVSEDKDTAEDIAKHIDVQREWAVDQMVALVRNRHVIKSEDWVLQVLLFLLAHAMYHVTGPIAKSDLKDMPVLADTLLGKAGNQSEPAISAGVHKACSQRLFSALAEVSSWPALAEQQAKPVADNEQQQKGRSHAHDGTTQSGEFWVYHVYAANQKLYALAKKGKGVAMTKEMPDEVHESYDSLASTIEKCRVLEKKRRGADAGQVRSHARAFELLCLNTALLLLHDPADYMPAVEDLNQCFKREFESKPVKTPKKKKKGEEEEEEDEPEAVEVMTDILLQLLSKPSALLRAVCEHVFRVYCHQLTQPALQLILDVVKEEFKGGSSDVLETVDDELDGEGEDDSEHEHEHGEEEEGEAEEKRPKGEKQKQKQKQPANEEGEGEGESEEEEEESESEGGEEEDGPVIVDEHLRLKVREALGDAAQASDADSDEDIGDEGMAAFDEKLAEVFRNRKAIKAEKRDLLQTVLHFKMRTLDLLEIFLRKQPTNPLVLDLFLPLLDAYKKVPSIKTFTVLRERLYGVIVNKLCRLKECPHAPAVEVARMNEIMEELFTAAYKASDKKTLSVISQLLMLCLRVCIGSSGADPSPLKTRSMRKRGAPGDNVPKEKDNELGQLDLAHVKSLYSAALSHSLTKKHGIMTSAFFVETFRRYPGLASALSPEVTSACQAASTPYAQTQAVALMEALFRAVAAQSAEQTIELCKTTQPWMESLLRSFAKGDNSKLKSKHVKAAVKTILQMLHGINRRLDKKPGDGLDVSSLQAAIQELMSATVAIAAPSISTMCRDALRILDPTYQPSKKQKKAAKKEAKAAAAATSSEETKGSQTPGSSGKKSTPGSSAKKSNTPSSAKKTEGGGVVKDAQQPSATPAKKQKTEGQVAAAAATPKAQKSAKKQPETNGKQTKVTETDKKGKKEPETEKKAKKEPATPAGKRKHEDVPAEKPESSETPAPSSKKQKKTPAELEKTGLVNGGESVEEGGKKTPAKGKTPKKQAKTPKKAAAQE